MLLLWFVSRSRLIIGFPRMSYTNMSPDLFGIIDSDTFEMRKWMDIPNGPTFGLFAASTHRSCALQSALVLPIKQHTNAYRTCCLPNIFHDYPHIARCTCYTPKGWDILNLMPYIEVYSLLARSQMVFGSKRRSPSDEQTDARGLADYNIPSKSKCTDIVGNRASFNHQSPRLSTNQSISTASPLFDDSYTH